MTDRVTQAQAVMQSLPHAQSLGMIVAEMSAGSATVTMPYDPRLIGDPSTGVLHGGAISALMDTASGAAVMCHPSAPAATATLDLRIDYMRPATPVRPSPPAPFATMSRVLWPLCVSPPPMQMKAARLPWARAPSRWKGRPHDA